jgi:hypothetical protein
VSSIGALVASLALGGLVLGCGAAQSAGDGTTRYRLHDRVVYRYAGSLLPAEVLLEEQITDVRGNRLRIEVTATRTTAEGEEVRRWIQVVTDTEENRVADRVDELYEVDAEGNATRLPNTNNEDLVELYEWTLPAVEWGDPGEEQRTTEELEIAGQRYRCEVSVTPLPSVGEGASVSLSECPDLVWTNGPSRLVRGGEVLWSVEVVEVASGRP